MTRALLTLALLLTAAAPVFAENPQAIRLAPGDFRWIPFTVKAPPTGVNCRFEVLEGGPSVHAELLPMSEFRLFDRGREHETLAQTPDGRAAGFVRVIDQPGQYAVVVVNDRKAGPVTIALHVETNQNPGSADVARTISPQRRLTVILISFAVFFVTVSWASRKLIVAMRDGHRS